MPIATLRLGPAGSGYFTIMVALATYATTGCQLTVSCRLPTSPLKATTRWVLWLLLAMLVVLLIVIVFPETAPGCHAT